MDLLCENVSVVERRPVMKHSLRYLIIEPFFFRREHCERRKLNNRLYEFENTHEHLLDKTIVTASCKALWLNEIFFLFNKHGQEEMSMCSKVSLHPKQRWWWWLEKEPGLI